MRVPRKYGFSLGTRLTWERQTHYVVLWAQPLHWWLISRVYRRYHMVLGRFPALSQQAWAKRQVRCHDLTYKHRFNLAELELDAETHEKIRLYRFPVRIVRSP